MTRKARLVRDNRRALVILGSMPIVAMGLLFVTFALLQAPWPSDPSWPASGGTLSYFERLRGEQAYPGPVVPGEPVSKDGVWYARRFLDALLPVCLIASFVSVGLAIWLEDNRALMVLTLVSIVGVGYGATVGLYPGPVLTVCGYSLVLFGAGLGWASQLTTDSIFGRAFIETAAQTGTGFDTYDSHSAA